MLFTTHTHPPITHTHTPSHTQTKMQVAQFPTGTQLQAGLQTSQNVSAGTCLQMCPLCVQHMWNVSLCHMLIQTHSPHLFSTQYWRSQDLSVGTLTIHVAISTVSCSRYTLQHCLPVILCACMSGGIFPCRKNETSFVLHFSFWHWVCTVFKINVSCSLAVSSSVKWLFRLATDLILFN